MPLEPSKPSNAPTPPKGVLARMRVRKKLLFLHTCFSLGLAAVLWLSIRPALTDLIHRAEADHAASTIALLTPYIQADLFGPEGRAGAGPEYQRSKSYRIRIGDAQELPIDTGVLERARAAPSAPVPAGRIDGLTAAVMALDDGRFVLAQVKDPTARASVWRLYALVAIALLAVYALVVLTLEVFVLPRHVYRPIRRMLEAERAVQQHDARREIIPDADIPADELGEIMLSRNESVRQLRDQEARLADALDQLETVANDLKRKNHLLETAHRNLADTDRLASLGMMSAGIAHELNTPLAVLKGLAEKLAREPDRSLPENETALMRRVIVRLERLGESLLDFARAREPRSAPASPHRLIEEAFTLVRLDRTPLDVQLENHAPPELEIVCDADRIIQVLVNLVRNAIDALRGAPSRPSAPRVSVGVQRTNRDGQHWVSITVEDNGPGIPAEILHSVFDPFVTKRYDARGTGLGLAVAEGIVHEHGGVILAQNQPKKSGAIFEIMIPQHADPTTAGPNSGTVPNHGQAN